MSRTRINPSSLLIVLLFLVAIIGGGWVVLRANGYRLLTNPVRFVKTGLISLRVHPDSQLSIYLNGKIQPSHQEDFGDLSPGRYTIKITSPGFKNWEQTVTIAAGQAIIRHDITLFYTAPTKEKITDPQQQAEYQPLIQDVSRFQHQLEIIGDEVWAGDELVTRYSSPITEAIWYPDETHILILVKNQLHVVEFPHGNDTPLFDLGTAQNVTFVPLDGGQKILVQTDGQLFLYTVTDPYSLIPLPSF